MLSQRLLMPCALCRHAVVIAAMPPLFDYAAIDGQRCCCRRFISLMILLLIMSAFAAACALLRPI